MDQQRLLEQFQAAAKAAARRVAENASSSRQDMASMEQRIYDELDALKATFLQQWIDHAKDDSGRPSCPHCGGRMRQKEQLPKTSSCIGGSVTVPRTRWWCSSCGESFFPLDETTTVGGHAVTPQAGRLAVQEAAQRPYEQTANYLKREHRLSISKKQLEDVTIDVGTYWLERDRQEYEQMAAGPHPPPARVEPPEKSLVFVDGVTAHVDGAWHVLRVGTVRSEYAANAGGGTQTPKSSLVRFAGWHEFGQELWRHASQRGWHQAKTKAFLADGEHALWQIAERFFDGAVQVLDFYHLSDHVHRCADVFFGEASDGSKQWSRAACQQLRAGLVDDALKAVEMLPARGKSKRKAKHELITYLTNNRTRMDYPRYEKLGLPIGSGEVEAQCKTLVQARCKQSGMRWKRSGLEPLLRVRCAVKDGSYETRFGLWPTNLTEWTLQVGS